MARVVTALKRTGIVLAALVALLVAVLVIVPPVTRSFTDSWGATDEEVAAALPVNFGGALFSRNTMVGIKRTTEALEQ